MPRSMTPLPEDAPIVQRAAHAFHRVACDALSVRTQAEVASYIGEPVQGYSSCLRARRGTLDRVHKWIVRLSEHDVQLEMRLTADTVEIRHRQR